VFTPDHLRHRHPAGSELSVLPFLLVVFMVADGALAVVQDLLTKADHEVQSVVFG
jgi:hypothetical protein